MFQVVNLWDLHDYSCKATVPTYEALEAVCVIHPESPFASSLALLLEQFSKKRNGLPQIHFITVGERGVVRIWNSDGCVIVMFNFAYTFARSFSFFSYIITFFLLALDASELNITTHVVRTVKIKEFILCA